MGGREGRERRMSERETEGKDRRESETPDLD